LCDITTTGACAALIYERNGWRISSSRTAGWGRCGEGGEGREGREGRDGEWDDIDEEGQVDKKEQKI
jgi:hypothetical protein